VSIAAAIINILTACSVALQQKRERKGEGSMGHVAGRPEAGRVFLSFFLLAKWHINYMQRIVAVELWRVNFYDYGLNLIKM